MNLVYGQLVEISHEAGIPIGKVLVRGARKKAIAFSSMSASP
jgi:hypothetical protein